MAIGPVGGNSRFLVGQRDKSASSTQVSDDADETSRGQGVIDDNGEYASMSMLAASHIRRGGGKADHKEEWMSFAERILDGQADEKLLHVEGVLHGRLMTPQQLRAFLLQYFTDPSDLLMALAALINRNRLKRKQIEHLNELRELLEAEDLNRSAQAGVNIALVAKAFAQRMQQSAGDLRMLYREFLSYEGPVVYLYEQWADEQDAEERENIMRYLARALACDLQVLPLGNVNVNEFGRFFNRVRCLREMQSLDGIFRQRFLHAGFAFVGQYGEKALSQLFTRGIRDQACFSESLLTFFSQQLCVLSSDMRARFLQILIIAFSTLPTGVFQSLEEREHLMTELKESMDHLMAMELTLAQRTLSDKKENIL
ncbi:type III secretion system gatekeeper subunit SctW [Yersinia enterocolitica]|jgi:type III secretion system YopN/LcrE/InvE/MxiC family regulator|uniref:Type III secreted effector protein n=2 Tax=Yersinia TaxID=629 RepID=A0AAI8ZQ01_YERFR|nr:MULTISPECIES: type III secretion system gatekeeper subunit SctW [Yersinia]ATM88347.1 YopN family type III secretion system gatekeeper subunit [Yersinia frederiksenii]AVX39883.1 YopN family type III secretion system gatekeeper subunit [Yersinia massiliensis]MCB5316995.1 type III secretion system gatekeeper subunit SctW [Yersinia massiliensis]MDN0126120.1 type III secretion system gatekeeper subunit SctW [Yersinia massiliensis]QKJ10613.1 type III secretion system gatekeeper subunit SctW [Yers